MHHWLELSSFVFFCFCAKEAQCFAPFNSPWASGSKNALGSNRVSNVSLRVIGSNIAESTQDQKTFPESQTLGSILSAKPGETTYHSLSNLRSYRSWDFSWPTITKPHRLTPRHTYASDRAFFATMQGHNRGVTHDLLTAVGAFDEVNSVVLFGGALVDIVTKREGSIRDWDLRLVGEEYVNSPEKCVEAAKQFIRNIFGYLKKENDRIQIMNQERKQKGEHYGESLFDIQAVKITRAQSTVTVVVPGRGYQIQETTLQFTFAPHATLQIMLSECFPHCSRIAVKDNVVVLDAAAKYCLESLCVVLDTNSFNACCCAENPKNKNSGSISRLIGRAIRYFDAKGFDVVLPQLDMDKLAVRNLEFGLSEVLALPEMTVVYDDLEDNKIMASQIGVSKTSHRFNAGQEQQHCGYAASPKFDSAKFIHHNIRCLVQGIYDQFYFFAEGEVSDPVLDYAPQLTGRMIDKTYELVKKKYLSSGSVDINQVQRYFSATPPADVLDLILMDPLRHVASQKPGGAFPEAFKFDEKAVDALIEKEKEALDQKLAWIREVLQDKGLDQIVVEWPADVSSKDEILNALYGKYLLVEDSQD